MSAVSDAMTVLGPDSAGIALSRAEFDRADFQEGWRYELINGVLVVSPPPLEAERDPKEELGFIPASEAFTALRRKCGCAAARAFAAAPVSSYSAAMPGTIYKICPETLWRAAERAGRFEGAPVDLADGFIHFSTADQVRETAARHFSGQSGLLLIALDADRLGPALKFEPSRGGALFPHLYAPLDPTAAIWVKPLPLKSDGSHDFPELAP